MNLFELIFPSLPRSLSCHLIRERMKLPFMNDQCEQMLRICNEFVRLQVSYEEYLCMKVLLLLSTGITVQLSLNSGASQAPTIRLTTIVLYSHFPADPKQSWQCQLCLFIFALFVYIFF